MLEIKFKNNIFENIKHIDENRTEYWYARELQKVLEYTEWRKFKGVIDKAMASCINSNLNNVDHFVGADKMVKTGDSFRKIKDYKLSRYACYLIAQNGDSRKKVIALAQTYFAIQTRKIELSEMANDIAKRKGLRYRKNILDNMGSEELIDNLFRISQTNSKFKNDNIIGESNANSIHYQIGKNIRNVIKKMVVRYLNYCQPQIKV